MVLEEVDQNADGMQDKTDHLKPFTLEILKLVKTAQQQHGLRHGDYQRYRGYCSRRIGRLRKVLKIPQGDRRHFKKRNVTDAHINNPISDERYLHIPLMLAERCWSYAMQLRQESNTEPRKKFHMIRRLKKASQYAFQLEELCNLGRCNARTKLEAQAYVACIQGALYFEVQAWQLAAENLKKAQVVYEKLVSALPEEEQLPYRQRIEELGPNLRYCAYNIGEDTGVNLSELRAQGILENLDKFINQTTEQVAAILHEVEWYSMKVPIRIERVQLFLQSIADLTATIRKAENDEKRVNILENMFIDLRDIITFVRDEANAGKDKETQLLLNYLISIRIERTIERNIYLIKLSRKPQDIVRLIEIITQQLNEQAQLEALQEIKEFQQELSQKLDIYRSLRCFYIAKAYKSVNRWADASVFYDRSLKYAELSQQYNIPDDLVPLCKNIIDGVPSEIAVVRAQALLEKEGESEVSLLTGKIQKDKRALIERLDEFHDNSQYLTKNPNIVPLPPPLEPVPAKPLFYDLALNFVELPNLESELEDAQQKPNKGAAGISGLVKGLWGWGKK